MLQASCSVPCRKTENILPKYSVKHEVKSRPVGIRPFPLTLAGTSKSDKKVHIHNLGISQACDKKLTYCSSSYCFCSHWFSYKPPVC